MHDEIILERLDLLSNKKKHSIYLNKTDTHLKEVLIRGSPIKILNGADSMIESPTNMFQEDYMTDPIMSSKNNFQLNVNNDNNNNNLERLYNTKLNQQKTYRIDEVKSRKVSLKEMNNSSNNYYDYTFKSFDVEKPKNKLFLQIFSIFFKDNFFENKFFNNEIKKVYKSKFDENALTSLKYQLQYPVKVRNMFTENYIRLFIKPDIKAFHKKYIDIQYDYVDFKEYKNNSIILKNKREMIAEDLYQHEAMPFYECEYITLQGAIHGRIYIFSNYLLFIDSDVKVKSSELEYLFSSLETDIINKPKWLKLYFKNISYIINRRFLYMYQGNEIFLKNGRSYFFNLYNFNYNRIFLNEMNSLQLTVIVDCKKSFKKKEITKVKFNFVKLEMGKQRNIIHRLSSFA